jgi:hypothetical protein
MTKLSKSKKQKRTKERMNISAQKQEYSGPLSIPGSVKQKDLTLAKLIQFGNITSSGGVLNNVLSLQLNAFNNYTNYSSSYDEWRCLKARFVYKPLNVNSSVPATSSTFLLGGSIVGVVDRDSSNALSSLSAVEYGSAKVVSSNQDLILEFEMSGSEDAQFISSLSTSSAWFKIYASGLTTSAQYGNVFVEALFQFRGRN